jgi:hypothetical protein
MIVKVRVGHLYARFFVFRGLQHGEGLIMTWLHDAHSSTKQCGKVK